LIDAKFNYALRMGDDRLILSHRLAQWCGHGPILEEDIAMTNISLDLLGQANELLTSAGQFEGKGRDADKLAYHRFDTEFFNVKLVEQENGDFAYTLARQFLWDVFDYHFCNVLKDSKDETFAAIGTKSLKEVIYHVRHSRSWILKLGDGTEVSHQKIQDAIEEIWMFTGELFEMDEVDELLIKEGIVPDLNAVKEQWNKTVSETLAEATLKRPEDAWMQFGARKGQHTEYLGQMLAEMQHIPRAYPDAKW
jgi:ring-1,2-phenylacetyl-CoA epoxidase subunit PaaC